LHSCLPSHFWNSFGRNELKIICFPSQEFKRLFGVQPRTFIEMVETMRHHRKLKKTADTPKLSIEDQVLVALQYWRDFGCNTVKILFEATTPGVRLKENDMALSFLLFGTTCPHAVH